MEKIDEVVKKLKTEFKVDEKDDEQSWWDKFESIVTDANEIDLENNWKTFLFRWMVMTGKEGRIISENDDKSF